MAFEYHTGSSQPGRNLPLKSYKIPTIGWREWAALPDLGINLVKAKIDSGAKTSVLHTFKTERFQENKKDRIRFWVHPYQRNISKVIVCNADIWDYRMVSDSGGHKEYRFFIKTELVIEQTRYPIEISLTNRDTMLFRLLLGREALKSHFLVDVSKSYIYDKPSIKSLSNLKSR